ncbi:MAG: hypothetical protein AB7G93_13675 [Bdellovibrionales bacterium]
MGKETKKSNWIVGAGLIMALVLLFVFQGCTKSGPAEKSAPPSGLTDARLSGNGEGYGGKLSYVSRQLVEPCADGKPRSQILIANDLSEANVIREDCKEIEPTSVSVPSLNLMPHNMENLVYDGTLYDQDNGQSAWRSSLLCRSRAPATAVGQDNTTVDAVIGTPEGVNPPLFMGRVIVGIYDSLWNLVKVKDMGDVRVIPTMREHNPDHIYYENVSGSEHFILEVFRPHMNAQLFYFRSITPEETVLTEPELRHIQGLHCYSP